MNVPYTIGSVGILAVLLILGSVSFVIVRLRNASHATTTAVSGINNQKVASLLIGSVFLATLTAVPFNVASAQDLFILFTERGAELYHVDQVKQPTLNVNRHYSHIWLAPAPTLKIEESLFSVTGVGAHSFLLQDGMKPTGLSRIAFNSGQIDWSSNFDQEKPTTQKIISSRPNLNPELLETQHLARQESHPPKSLIPN